MCLPAEPASADDDMVFFDSIESACFESVTSNMDEFYDCASVVSPSIWDSLQSYIAYPLLGLPVMLAYAFQHVRCFLLTCSFTVSRLIQLLWIGLLFVLTVWYDTLLVILAPAQPTAALPRRIRRRKLTPLRGFPRRWMILSCLMLANAKSYVHPISHCVVPLSQTLDRCVRLDQLLQLTPSSLMSYNALRRSELLDISFDLYYSRYAITSTLPRFFNIIDTPVSADSDLFLFFDCNEINFESQFVDSCSNAAELEGVCTNIDFFDFDEPTFVPSPFNWLRLNDDLAADDTFYVSSKAKDSDLVPTPSNLPTAMAYNASLTGRIDPLQLSKDNPSFPIVFDSGASLAISGNKDDFIGPIRGFSEVRRLGGMAGGMLIEGIGDVRWTFRTKKGYMVVHTECYYVPDCNARLLSPQRLFDADKGYGGYFHVLENHSVLGFDNGFEPLVVEYDSRSNLPIALAKNDTMVAAHANLCILNDENQNLTPGQKLLLLWHAKFAHKNFPAVQMLMRNLPFVSNQKFLAASRCERPRCEVCEYGKAHRKFTKGNKQRTNPTTDGFLKDGDLRPGSSVSVDHFESRLKGRTYTSYGKTTSDQYIGGCIFVDHMSGYIHVGHQLGFSGSETIRVVQEYEKLAFDHGVVVDQYKADNGVFKARKFVAHVRERNQRISYCGVNAHHQNAIAERSIRTVSEMARSMMLHSSLRWKQGVDSSLWPMAVDYAVHIYNHLPGSNGQCPADLFTGALIPRHQLKNIHVWGCPVYVLDPKLQQGKKLPRWEPRSRQGVFVGYSPVHSSDVPLVLNLQSGSISPQYHVVFDDSFSTVQSLSPSEEPPTFWNEIGIEEHLHRVTLDDDTSAQLNEEWLTPPELEERSRHKARAARLRSSVEPFVAPAGTAVPGINPWKSEELPPWPAPSQLEEPSTDRRSSRLNEAYNSKRNPLPSKVMDLVEVVPVPKAAPSVKFASENTFEPAVAPRRSDRLKGIAPVANYCDEVYLSNVIAPHKSHHDQILSHTADRETDFSTGLLNCVDPRAYAAKIRRVGDPDNPSYTEAMSSAEADYWIKAMQIEITQLVKQETWHPVDRKDVPSTENGSRRKILNGTWAFKLKRLPDGTASKYKARYCVRGDQQTEGVDYFETYAPVVQWSTVRLLLTMILANDWTTRQVDYTNAFAQATLKEEVYIEAPRGYGFKDKQDKVLHLIKSLYGLKQAPRTFFEMLRTGLLERGFIQSEHDMCLFMKKDMICVVYVDDTILAGPDAAEIEKVITSLGVRDEEKRYKFELRDEGAVGDFLGIRIERTKSQAKEFKLSQSGLINKVLLASGMEDSNPIRTPSELKPLGINTDGEPFDEKWEYPTIVGMLMFLACNSRPDIAYAVNQCARFTHCPRQSHAIAVKRILRYLKGTKDEGMVLHPKNNMKVDCYVDADFAGLWGIEYDQDPTCVKSRSGHLIMFMGCPLLWSSKLQTLIALSTMEAEYVALSNAMRDLIGIREILKEIYVHVLCDSKLKNPSYSTVSKTFGLIPASVVHEDNQAALKFAQMPKMSPRTKHIAIPYHFFRSKVAELEIKVVAIHTNNQLADQFTKGLPAEKFVRDRKQLMGW